MSENKQNTVQASTFNRFYFRHLRENVAQLTQEQFAEKLNVQLSIVKNWESGRKPPSQKHLHALEQFFGVKPGALNLEMRSILQEDFSTAYFQNSDPRERIEWAEKHILIGQPLHIIPPHPKHEK